MTSRKARVVFMGSPAIAVATLEALSPAADVLLVVTQPARPSGRGRKAQATAVAETALRLGLETASVRNVNSPDAVGRVRALEPDAIVVASFGQILKRELLAVPARGSINVHFSLLPELRGAAPVSWAIIRGFDETGVSVMEMVPEMDAGAVYAQRAEAIRRDDTAATLSARLATVGAGLLLENLDAIIDGRLRGGEQDHSRATFAPKITRELGAVDWTLPARRVDALIRGLAGQLEAYAFLESAAGIRVTLHASAVADGRTPGPGVIARGPRGELLAGCGEGLVEITEIQAAGRRKVPGRDFANGYHLAGGERFRIDK